MMADKLGLNAYQPETDESLFNDLIALLQRVETDMTVFYRQLAMIPADIQTDDERLILPLMPAYYVPEQLSADYKTHLHDWLHRYIKRVQQDNSSDVERRTRMHAVNPKYVLRNYLAQLAIDKAETGDFTMVNELLDCLRKPYDEQPDYESYAEKRPDWARQRAGCSMLSCSS